MAKPTKTHEFIIKVAFDKPCHAGYALAEVKETKAQRDARRKREKRAAEKAAKNGFAGVPPVAQPATLDIYRKIPGESKRDRDARIKREKNAAKKAGQV